MTARVLEVTTFVLPDPTAFAQNPSLGPIQANTSLSYQLQNYIYVQTLSSDLNDIAPNEVQGLLYVPSLPSTDPCNAQAAQYIPQNVTRSANIPTTVYTAIALAPWFSIACTQSFLTAANQDAQFVRGIIFYQVNDTSTGTPPPVSNPIWTLNDGGHWKSVIQFPAYAVPGTLGRTFMNELSLYSGNVTTAPDGTDLTSVYGPGGEARLFADMTVDQGPSLPSLWIFLIIVLAILLAIIGASSLFMGILQRRRRNALRRRVENGEVDLETLGIKRMNVPQSELDKMPLYTFDQAPTTEVPTAANLASIPETKPTTAPSEGSFEARDVQKTATTKDETQLDSEVPVSETAASRQQFSQTTCAICLDDFVSGTTSVRELPCHHIFHPECVDVFLREHSSTCPVCKKSTLPEGFCPPIITNAMVRREQLLRRLRERRAAGTTRRLTSSLAPDQHQSSSQMQDSTALGFVAAWRERFHGRTTDATSGTSNIDVEAVPSVELSEINPPQRPRSTLFSSQRASVIALQSETDPQRRRELARQRAIANLTQQAAAREQDIQQEQQRLPIWRRAIGKVFPALTA